MRSPPFGRRVAAVHRVPVVEPGITPGNEISMEIGDRPVGVRINRIVGSVGAHILRLAERGVIRSLGAQIRLRERRHRVLQQLDGDPAPALAADDGTMMAAVHRESSMPSPDALLEGNGDSVNFEFWPGAAVAVLETVRIP